MPGTSIELSEAVVQGILNGEFDPDLDMITNAVRQRQRGIALVKSSNIRVGDTVKVGSRVTPKYLRGAQGVVTSMDSKWISVRVGEHFDTGRYSRNIKFQHGSLEKVESIED